MHTETHGAVRVVEHTVTKSRKTFRCELHTENINSASRKTSLCKKRTVCGIKMKFAPPRSQWKERVGCCRERLLRFNGKKYLSNPSAAFTSAPFNADSFAHAVGVCKEDCIDHTDCIASETRKVTKKKVAMFACEVHTANITATTKTSKSCKTALCSNILYCEINEKVASQTCQPCEPGTTSEGNANPFAGNTTCTPTLCDANEYVSNNVCTACATGYENADGDDASAEDTTCTPTVTAAPTPAPPTASPTPAPTPSCIVPVTELSELASVDLTNLYAVEELSTVAGRTSVYCYELVAGGETANITSNNTVTQWKISDYSSGDCSAANFPSVSGAAGTVTETWTIGSKLTIDGLERNYTDGDGCDGGITRSATVTFSLKNNCPTTGVTGVTVTAEETSTCTYTFEVAFEGGK